MINSGGITMGFDSLRSYLSLIEDKGLLAKVDGAHWDCEIGEITEVAAFSEAPRAVLFDKVVGYPSGFRVGTNLYSSLRLQAIALGLPEHASKVDMVSHWRSLSKTLTPISPRIVDSGPVMENVISGSDVNLLHFPVPLWRKGDGGRFLGTGDVVVTRDVEENWVNLGVYRAQIHDEKTLGIVVLGNHHGRIHLEKFWRKGESAPIAVVAGQSPHVYAGACMSLPWGQSEYDMAGAFNRGPIDVIIHPGTGLPVPSTAELVIFGHVPPPEVRSIDEGPFGECLGYYTGHGPAPVIEVEEIWHRNNPILQGSPTMHGSAMMHGLGGEIFTSAGIWDSIEREVQGVVGVCSLYQQCQAGSSVLVVSIKQAYPGHAKHAAIAALGSRSAILMNSAVVVVDDDVNPSDPGEVMFAVTTRCDPSKDMDVIRGIPSTFLDPRIPEESRLKGDTTTSSIIVDACRPYARKGSYPQATIISPSVRKAVIEKWGDQLFAKVVSGLIG
jgi:4-hydroxy-3-polyprenylbenzoate decarboxylase